MLRTGPGLMKLSVIRPAPDPRPPQLVDMVLFLDMRHVLLALLRRLRAHWAYAAAQQRLEQPPFVSVDLGSAHAGGEEQHECELQGSHSKTTLLVVARARTCELTISRRGS
jgi:hypothetical protein